MHTSIAKKDLDVQTKMSDSIFLDPVEPSQKTIYLNIRNTSDKTNFDITGTVARALELTNGLAHLVSVINSMH